MIKISGAELQNYAKTMREDVEKMKEALNIARNAIDSTSDSFRGDAAELVRSRFQELSPKFNDFYSAMTGYAEFLDKTAKSYIEAEQKISDAAVESLDDGTI